MNKPDILSIARQQLCDAISNFQTPPCTSAECLALGRDEPAPESDPAGA